MSDALRTLFAEFGFEVDEATLDKLEKRLDGITATTKKTAKANDDAAKAASEAAKKQKAEADEVAKKLNTWTGWIELAGDALATKLGGALKSLSPRLDAMASKLGLTDKGLGKVAMGASAAAAAALALGARAVFDFAEGFAAASEELRDTARESRVTSQELQGLDHAASMAGVGVERMRSGLHTFGESLRKAERWGNGTTSTLRRLGIQARDSSGRIRPTVDLLDEVAVAMQRVESPTRRARVATQLFGESGRRLLDVLHEGPGGIRALREELEDLGGGVTPEAEAASRAFTQQTERLSRAQDSLRSVVATTLLPALSFLVERGAHAVSLFAKITRGTHVLELAFGAAAVAAAVAAGAIIVAWWPVIAPVIAVSGAIGALILIVDDLITFVNGGDSALGRFIDSMFGVGTSAEYAHELREEWEAIVSAVEKAIGAVAEFLDLKPDVAVGRLGTPSFATAATGSPRRGAARAAGPGARATTTTGAAGAPATVRVAAPGAVTNASTTTVTRSTTNHFTITNPDPREAAREAARLIEQQQQQQRDADHAQEDDS